MQTLNKVLTINIWWNEIKILSLYSKLNIMTTKENLLLVLDLQKNQVRESFPSLFSREDVLTILDGIEDQVKSIKSNESVDDYVETKLNELVKQIKENVQETIENYDFDGEIEVELSYSREITIEFDSNKLWSEVEDSIRDTTGEFIDELAVPDEVESPE
jgi:predicted RNA-binding protein Jag